MKAILLILFFLFIQLFSFGQDTTVSFLENSTHSKVIVLITLAVIAVHNFIKWTNENNRTDP